VPGSPVVRNRMSDPTNTQTPEQFAAHLRIRAEEALSASVHHASLSQQYLTLSQKFAALAQQAAGNPADILQSVYQLEREAATGAPSSPIAARQVFGPVSVIRDASSSSLPEASSQHVRFGQTRTDPPHAAAGVAASFFSPPAKFASAISEPPAVGSEAASTSPDVTDASRIGSEPAASLGADQSGKAVTAMPKAAVRKKRRQRVSLRKLLDRARMVALEQAERVRVRAKKSDLKPQLRTTTEEIKAELKRGRGPAAISTFVMVLALLILMLQRLEYTEEVELPPLVAGFSDKIEPVEESLPIEPPAEVVGEQLEQPIEEPIEEPVEEEMVEEPEPEPEPEPVPEPVIEPITEPAPEEELAEMVLPETDNGTLRASAEAESTDGAAAVDNRSEAGRRQMLEKFGGSAASESAVGYALEWLAARQRANGSWDFIDVGPCKNPGTVNNPIGGTAYALLPFLAAGQTHKEGQYKKQILAGLDFLTSIGVRAPAGYDLRGVINKSDKDEDPNYAYYVHGAATLALCEAYGMTKDRKLKPFAEEAAKFLINSQDPRGGGWRYNPQQSGSTSATAIQVMALKAAEKAGIKIPDSTWKGVTVYLDSVSIDGEGRYGYEIEKKSYTVAVTSMAVLSRMYLGQGRDNSDLQSGVVLIDKKGPYDNLYYNYFATQVMKNWGGKEWDRWNGRLRDDLIGWQEKGGDAKGSWTPRDRDDYSKAGGRLLTTSLATLTLEVYYRYKPLLPENPDSDASAPSNAAPADAAPAGAAGTEDAAMTEDQ